MIVISNTSKIESKIHKTEDLENYQVAYLKPRMFLEYLMYVIFTILMQIWLYQQGVPVPQSIMGHHTGNAYYSVAINPPVLVYLVRIHASL